MHLVHVTASFSRAGGGVATVVQSLVARQTASGHTTRVCGLRDRHTAQARDAVRATHVYAGAVRGPRAVGYSPALHRYLAALPAVDIVHSHGLWMYTGKEARGLAARHRAPLVISPHAMLQPWARRRARWKKRIAARLFERANLAAAACFMVEAPSLVPPLREQGIRAPVAVVPNGVNPDDYAGALAAAPQFRSRWPETAGRPLALLLARLHPVKGIAHLLRAWAQVRDRHPAWMLVLAGPDEDGYRAGFERLAASLGITSAVLFTGPVRGELKLAALGAADGFVMPSVGEGLSMATLEALACGLPVLTSRQANLPEIETAGAGLLCEPTTASTAEALDGLLGLDAEARRAMGERGRRLVEKQYTLDIMATRVMRVYRWLAQGESRPACVTTV